MSDIFYIRKEDQEADDKQRKAVAFMESMTQKVRDGALNGFMFVGIEQLDDDVKVECEVHRTWVFTGAVSLLSLAGATKVVLDEVSEYFRGFVVE